MQDLDLDELDQAVTQIMDKPKAKKTPKKAQAVAVASTTPATPSPAQSKPVVAQSSGEPAATTVAVRPLPRPAPRKRMRPGAMDIIQRPQTPAKPKREGVPLQPTKPVVPEPPKVQPGPAAPVMPQPPTAEDVSDDVLASLNMHDDTSQTVKPKVLPTPSPEPAAPIADEAWPDPLDLHGFAEPVEQSAAPSPTLPDEPQEEPPTLEPASPTPEEPAVSPFVTTKVEKRPLGAYAAVTTEPTPPVAAGAAEPAPEPPQPGPTKAEMAEASLKSDQHLPRQMDEAEPTPDNLRQMAIPQQYHTAQAKPNEAIRNVFDTKEYHAPPQPMHTERRASPWFAVTVAVLVVLIVAVAAIGYLMMTGTIDTSQFM